MLVKFLFLPTLPPPKKKKKKHCNLPVLLNPLAITHIPEKHEQCRHLRLPPPPVLTSPGLVGAAMESRISLDDFQL